ncbi:MAG TPA: hypothetical protein VGL55_05195 [Steroidobacteraceae bacterium]|jgi:hypothetical protein
MQIARLCLYALALAALAACGVSSLDPDSPHSVDLSGNWVLNHAASDDPQKLFDKLRPKATTHRDMSMTDDGLPPYDSGQQDGQSGGPRGRRQQPLYRNNGFITHTQVMRALSADVARADKLSVRQTPSQMTLDYGNTARTFTPGTKSVVSAAWGVADQSSGFKGKEFVIQVKPQTGVRSVESFSLSPDGKHLIEQLHLGGGEYPSVELKRVYDHTDSPLPRVLPTND